LRPFFFLLLFFTTAQQLHAQVIVSGTVYDITKANLVENVRVVSSGGMFAITDSMGRYTITVNLEDSLSFVYNNKPTQKFSVATIAHKDQFDISLKVPVKSKYSVLSEVKVFSKSYKQDSIENRETYADIFEYRKPGVRSSIGPGGSAGADLNELINVFRFRRNRSMKAFQQRLEQQEQEKYVDHRFNKIFVRRVTQLEPPLLDTFIKWYRPSYEFTAGSDELTFNQYILNASYQFRKLVSLAPRKEPE
jgi:hypothetical protein